jgi:anti-sigma-K factor RskA
LLISVLVLWQQNRAMQREMTRLTTEMRGTQQKIERAQALSELLTAPGVRMTSLAATKEAPGAKAMLAYDRTGHAMLMAKGLSAPPSGKAYQLWYIVGNKPMPGKVFTTDESGNGMLDEQLPQVALNGAVFAITMEPKEGVEAPTGAILLSGS